MLHKFAVSVLTALIPSTHLGTILLLLGLWLVVGIAGCAVVGL